MEKQRFARVLVRWLSCCAGLLTLMLATAPSLAAAECSSLFPDFSCDDRTPRFEGFVAPMSHPFYFEDPFITTNVSLWALWHAFPDNSVFQGGDAIGYAAQVRVALTERLGLIATKDGRVQLRPDLPLLSSDEKGYLDWGFGLKYALIHDPDQEFILTPSLRYETTNGSNSVLNGNGQGVWIPAVSMAKGLGDVNLVAALGARLPVDGDAESSVIFYNLHLSTPVSSWFVPFVEINGFSYYDDGDGTNTIKLKNGTRASISAVQGLLGLDGFEGFDVANLGSDDVEGNDVISGSVGFRILMNRHSSLGFAYERPITSRRDILKQRIWVNVLFEY